MFCQQLAKYLIEKKDNVDIMFDSEVEKFIFHEEPEKKHLVRAVKIKGREELVECDTLVLSAGPFIARMLKEQLRLVCPVVPVKGYSFNILTKTDHHKMHLYFRDKGYVATYIADSTWRIAAFGDLSGMDKSFDPRRVRYLKNVVSEGLNMEEAHSY